ncbi:MAG: hypothetical protein IJJ99_02920 [Oscillospiraceae bacterium]|nr:hypothetical protein [Oscillospiraceae bacterium]
MPRLKPSAAQQAAAEAERRKRSLLGTLNKYRMICGFNSWELAAPAIGMSRATIFRRIREPETFTLDELHRIVRVLQIPKDEISDIIFS